MHFFIVAMFGMSFPALPSFRPVSARDWTAGRSEAAKGPKGDDMKLRAEHLQQFPGWPGTGQLLIHVNHRSRDGLCI